MDQFEGSMITSENSRAARESSRVIISKSRLNSTGHSACTSEVREIFDRQTHVPNDCWQLICLCVLQPWDRCNSKTAPVRNITRLVWFGLLWFSGTSTIVGYVMRNPVFKYISNIWFVNTFCRCTQLNDETVLFLKIQWTGVHYVTFF